MAVPRDIRQRIEKGDIESVESAWLERVADQPEDLDWFVGIARHLTGSGHGDSARTLLEVLDDELRLQGRRAERLDLLRAAGEILVAKSRFHDTVLERLREMWSAHSSFEDALETFGLRRAPRDHAEVWDRVGRLESVLRFTPGSIVWVEGHGAGRVGEVNLDLEGFKIELVDRGDLRVGFRAAGKLLTLLGPDHFVVHKIEVPDRLRELSPPELLERILTSFQRPVTAAEIRAAVEGLVPPERWTSWWSAARRHPQVVASPDVRNAYIWAGSSEEATSTVWRQFEGAQPAAQIELLRKADTQDPDLRRRMIDSLLARARDAAATEPALAFEIALALDRFAPEAEPPPAQEGNVLGRAAALVAAAENPDRLLSSIPAKAVRARAYELVREVRSDWAAVYASAILAESEPSLLSELVRTLGAKDPVMVGRLVDRALVQPADAPAFFTWIAERAGVDESLRGPSPLRLFKRILTAVGRDELQPFRKRLAALAESGGTLPRLLPHLDVAEAADALESVRRTTGLTLDRRRALEDAVLVRFPALRETEEPLYALEESIRRKRGELKALLEDEIPRNRRAIEEARAHGDLRENFEYKAARQRHEYLSARAEALSNELARSKPIDFGQVDLSRVGIGTAARLRSEEGEERSLILLGPWESDPEAGVLSYQSEVGRLLLGRKPGEELDLGGKRYRVVAIDPAPG
ncbi:MAG TPA: GreA/GreB family elongation factor [Thermoanaerobaculia bacterium]|nr:GreA/GreB family elongation factor [Thermoanaerobaculia bacterium]